MRQHHRLWVHVESDFYLIAPRSPPDPSCCGVLEPHFEMHFGVHFGDFSSFGGSFWGPFCSLFGGLSMRWMTFHVLELSGLLFPLPFGTSLGLFWVSFFDVFLQRFFDGLGLHLGSLNTSKMRPKRGSTSKHENHRFCYYLLHFGHIQGC